MLKAFFKDSIIYFVPSIISRGISLFLVPLYTRVLKPADYGSLDLLSVFASIINLTLALEISQGLARYFASEENKDKKITYASSAFWFTFFCYSLFAFFMLLNTKYFSSRIMGQIGLESAYKIGILNIWVNGLFYLIQNQFRWELKSKYFAFISLLMSFTTAAVSIWLTYSLKWGLNGILLGMFSGSFLGTCLGLYLLRNTFQFRFEKSSLIEMLKFSSPLVFSGVAVWVSLYVDRLLISHFLTINDVGLYGIGYRLASVAGLIMIGFQSALTPLVYTYYKEKDTPQQLEKIFRLFLSAALLMYLCISLFSIDILKLFTSPPFYAGWIVVVYLVPSIFLANMYIFAPGISIAKKNNYLIWINVSGAILNLILNIIFIPFFGIEGAGFATLLSYLSIFLAYMYFSQRLYFVPHKWNAILINTCFACIMAWALPRIHQLDYIRWLLNCLAIVIFCFVILMTRLVKLSEIKRLITLSYLKYQKK
jgi:O-antigen/teichoic acid export membrane protein